MLHSSAYKKKRYGIAAGFLLPVLLCVAIGLGIASSHREAPGLTSSPQLDATDFYMFRSYEPGREGFVTLLANYNPLQAPHGGPNFYPLNPRAAYDIHITNDGDVVEDITFRFRPIQSDPRISILTGPQGEQIGVPTALPHVFAFGIDDEGNVEDSLVNTERSYYLQVIRGGVNGPQPRDRVCHERGDRPVPRSDHLTTTLAPSRRPTMRSTPGGSFMMWTSRVVPVPEGYSSASARTRSRSTSARCLI